MSSQNVVASQEVVGADQLGSENASVAENSQGLRAVLQRRPEGFRRVLLEAAKKTERGEPHAASDILRDWLRKK